MLYSCRTLATLGTVHAAANRLLYYLTGDPDKKVLYRWTKAQTKRNAQYFYTITLKPIAVKRLASYIVDEIQEHFNSFKKCKEYWGIQNNDIYNFDETGFWIRVTSGEKVIVLKDTIAAYSVDPENRELITSVETLNYSGRKVPLMIIFSGAYYLQQYFNNNLDDNILFACSNSGYSNDKLGLKYLEHFNYFTESKSTSKYRLLIFDGYSSYLNQEFIDFCQDYYIRPFLLLLYTIHLLQPLDIGVFQALKHNFKKTIQKEVFLGTQEITRTDFFSFFQSFHNKTFKNPRIYKSTFKKTGLIPLDPLLVLSKIKEYQALQRLQTPPCRSLPAIFQSSSLVFDLSLLQIGDNYNIPLTICSRKQGVEYIRKRYFDAIEQGLPITPLVVRVADKIKKVSEALMLSGALAKHRLYDIANTEAVRKKRKEESSKVVQKYSEIRVKHVRLQIEADKEDEHEVINVQMKRKQLRQRKDYEAVINQLNEGFELPFIKKFRYPLEGSK